MCLVQPSQLNNVANTQKEVCKANESQNNKTNLQKQSTYISFLSMERKAKCIRFNLSINYSANSFCRLGFQHYYFSRQTILTHFVQVRKHLIYYFCKLFEHSDSAEGFCSCAASNQLRKILLLRQKRKPTKYEMTGILLFPFY